MAGLPANILAVPVAGPLMMWGLAAGLPAGLIGGLFARIVHLPTEGLVAWVAAVARWGAAAPLGRLRLPHLVFLAVLALAIAWVRRRGARAVRRGLVTAGVAVLLAPAVGARWPASVDGVELATGATLWRRGGATVMVVEGATSSPGRLLSALHEADVRRLDLLVVANPGVAAARGVEPLLRRFPAGVLLAPAGTRLAGAVVPADGTRVEVGPLAVDVDSASPRLAVRVGPARAPPST